MLWLDAVSGRLVGYDTDRCTFTELGPESDWGAAYNALVPQAGATSASAATAGTASTGSTPRSQQPDSTTGAGVGMGGGGSTGAGGTGVVAPAAVPAAGQQHTVQAAGSQPHKHLHPARDTLPFIEQSAMTGTTTLYMPMVSSLTYPVPVRRVQAAPGHSPQGSASNHLGSTGGAAAGVGSSGGAGGSSQYPRQYYGVLYCSRTAPDGDVLPPEFSGAEVGLLGHVARHTALLLDSSEGLELLGQ